MSKYSDKVAARRAEAALDLAVRITDREIPPPAPPAPPAPPKPKQPPPPPRGVLVDLGDLPARCSAAFDEAAAALDRAAEAARGILERAQRSVQSGEALGAAGLAEKAAALCQIKTDDSLLSLFFLGLLCNIFIYSFLII